MLLSVYERKGHITIDLCRLCVSVRASVRLSVTTRQRRHGFAVDSLVLHFFSPRLFFFWFNEWNLYHVQKSTLLLLYGYYRYNITLNAKKVYNSVSCYCLPMYACGNIACSTTYCIRLMSFCCYLHACCEQVLFLVASVCLCACLHKISKTTYQKLM